MCVLFLSFIVHRKCGLLFNWYTARNGSSNQITETKIRYFKILQVICSTKTRINRSVCFVQKKKNISICTSILYMGNQKKSLCLVSSTCACVWRKKKWLIWSVCWTVIDKNNPKYIQPPDSLQISTQYTSFVTIRFLFITPFHSRLSFCTRFVGHNNNNNRKKNRLDDEQTFAQNLSYIKF